MSSPRRRTTSRRRPSNLKQYVGISRDHSQSMNTLTRLAMVDYNSQIESIAEAAEANDIETIVSVVRCGVGRAGYVEREVVNSSVTKLQPLGFYLADGGSTPLFQSVAELIDILESTPDADDSNVSFLVEAITDGQNNSGNVSGESLGRRIRQLQATDRWTFVFRVPRGYAEPLAHLGIPAGNIQEWEQSERGIRESTVVTRSAMGSYFAGRTRGIKSTGTFYADLSGVTKKDVKSALVNVSSQADFFTVKRGGENIRDFVETKTRRDFQLGSAFYQLNKPEKKVQDHKLIALRDKTTGAVYVGVNARDLLGLPDVGTIKLEPGNSPKYDIFVQSTSVNRKLIAGTEVMVWTKGAQLSRAARAN